MLSCMLRRTHRGSKVTSGNLSTTKSEDWRNYSLLKKWFLISWPVLPIMIVDLNRYSVFSMILPLLCFTAVVWFIAPPYDYYTQPPCFFIWWLISEQMMCHGSGFALIMLRPSFSLIIATKTHCKILMCFAFSISRGCCNCAFVKEWKGEYCLH